MNHFRYILRICTLAIVAIAGLQFAAILPAAAQSKKKDSGQTPPSFHPESKEYAALAKLDKEGQSLLDKNHVDGAESKFLKGAELAVKYKDEVWRSVFMVDIGKVYEVRQKPEKAIECYQAARVVFAAYEDYGNLALVLNAIGYIYYQQSAYEKALAVHQQSLKLSQTAGDEAEIQEDLYNIGADLDRLGKAEAASARTRLPSKAAKIVAGRERQAENFRLLGINVV